MSKVSVIIPLYNQWNLTYDCLHSLREHTDTEAIEVIAVDNGSTDATSKDCPDVGRSLFGENFHFIRLEKNSNFGPACNLGAAKAKNEYLFFLNNDTLLTKNWLDPLVNAFTENNRLGAVGPLLTYPDGRVQHMGVCLSPVRNVCHLYHQFPAAHRVVHKKRSLQAITAAAMLMPQKIFEQTEGFYPGYRNGFEDLDLCARIRRQNLELTCIAASRVVHLTSQSEGRFDADRENATLFTKRCHEDYTPDEHLWAYEDGFSLALSSDFTPYFIYEQEPPDDISRIWEQIQKEPLWEQGYTTLLTFFREHKMWDEALELLLMQQVFFSSYELVVETLRVATRLGRKDILAAHQEHLKTLEKNRKTAKRKCLATMELARHYKDNLLLAACKTWLQNYGISQA